MIIWLGCFSPCAYMENLLLANTYCRTWVCVCVSVYVCVCVSVCVRAQWLPKQLKEGRKHILPGLWPLPSSPSSKYKSVQTRKLFLTLAERVVLALLFSTQHSFLSFFLNIFSHDRMFLGVCCVLMPSVDTAELCSSLQWGSVWTMNKNITYTGTQEPSTWEETHTAENQDILKFCLRWNPPLLVRGHKESNTTEWLTRTHNIENNVRKKELKTEEMNA